MTVVTSTIVTSFIAVLCFLVIANSHEKKLEELLGEILSSESLWRHNKYCKEPKEMECVFCIAAQTTHNLSPESHFKEELRYDSVHRIPSFRGEPYITQSRTKIFMVYLFVLFIVY